jgi:hypothetical protein
MEGLETAFHPFVVNDRFQLEHPEQEEDKQGEKPEKVYAEVRHGIVAKGFSHHDLLDELPDPYAAANGYDDPDPPLVETLFFLEIYF